VNEILGLNIVTVVNEILDTVHHMRLKSPQHFGGRWNAERETTLRGPLETNHIRFSLFPVLPEDRGRFFQNTVFFWGVG
jgi:hypothetical protein